MAEGKELEPKGSKSCQETGNDDLYDGLLRDVVSREVAQREGRDEGYTVVIEPIPGGQSVVVGRRESLDRFHQVLEQEKASYREVEVGCFPRDPEKVERVRRMLIPRLSEARKRLGLPGLPLVGELIEGALESAEDAATTVGIPLEEKTKGATEQPDLEETDKTFEEFNTNFE